jgi:hypothetical protein
MRLVDADFSDSYRSHSSGGVVHPSTDRSDTSLEGRLAALRSPSWNSIRGAAAQAEKLGYTIEVEAFRAAGFATKFSEALGQHNEPEVITFDNFGVLVGITTALGRYDGILSTSEFLHPRNGA